MTLSRLSIFSRDTDANEVLKGYEYQKLRTLEIWLDNKVNHRDEIIYCEYEDDIFQQSAPAGKSKFTQLKLYGSKAFSFKSEEIVKAITHFFTLFVKGEYSFDEIQFVFETNTQVAGKYGDNDAELLELWVKNQEKLEDGLVKKCATKLKGIVTSFVHEQLPKLIQENKAEAQLAHMDFIGIPDAVWEAFVRSIHWVFNNESPDDALAKVNESIKALIKTLPFPSSKDETEKVFTALYYEVSVRMFQNEPEDRCLSSQRIDELILDLGNDADKQYNLAFQSWSDVQEVKHFRLGEFLEVLSSTNYCRVSPYLEEHSTVWLRLLNSYLTLPDTPDKYRQEAIYEFLWLSLRPTWFEMPKGTLVGHEGMIRGYFSRIQVFTDHDTVENHFSLLQIIRASIIMGKCELKIEETQAWMDEIGQVIEKQLSEVQDPSQNCYWLELQSEFLAHPLTRDGSEPDLEKVFATYDKMIELLPQAPQYNVSRLSDRVNQIIKLYIQLGGENDKVKRLEELGDKLVPHVQNRGGNHELAKVYRDRGIKYLESKDPLHLGTALSYFHKAKDLWNQGETVQGYILSLLNISQVYSAFHMNFAAKNYALSAVWFCIHNNPEKLIGRITSAFGLIFHADFKQGSWISALDSFRFYVRSRLDWEAKPIDIEDEMLRRTLMDVAGLISMAPKVSPQLSGFIEFHKQIMGPIYTEYLAPMKEVFDENLEKTSLDQFIRRICDASPVNDIGEKRTIEWKAFGSTWSVAFPNTWEYSSVGEEFAAFLQILFVELASTETDLHFLKTHVEIELEIIDGVKQPEQLPSNYHFKWKVYTKFENSSDAMAQRYQMGSLTMTSKFLLRDVSMLKDDDVFMIVDRLFQANGLAQKAMSGSLYQRIYRGLFAKESFDESQRNVFTKEVLGIDLTEAQLLSWNAALSPYYSQGDSHKQIAERYKNSLKGTHMTIEQLKTQTGYNEWVAKLRNQGWLDWQILMAMYNHILNYKADDALRGQTFANEEAGREAFNKEFQRIRYLDDQDYFVRFPLDYFEGPHFELQLNHTGYLVMQTWGLENRASFPNFPAIREFLNNRFNYDKDDVNWLSPF